jgi:DNA-binding YbaB/EbfC family protein
MASIGEMGNLLKQAQEMQTRMAKIQEELGQKTVQGSAGGGMVQVTVNGQFSLTTIQIEPSVIKAEEKELLEDLVLAAVNRV